MNRTKDCVVAVYENIAEAQDAVQEIGRSDVPTDPISLVSAMVHPGEAVDGSSCDCHHDLPAECPRTCRGNADCEWSGACVPKTLQFGDDDYMERDTVVGAGVGGLVGLFAAAGLFALVNGQADVPFKLMAMAPVIVGTCLGAIVGWGVHSNQLSWYEQKVKAGKTLLLAHGGPSDVARSAQVLQDTRPVELHVHDARR